MTGGEAGFATVIGLEVHVQLATASKLFCRCPVLPDAPPNHLVCPICTGHPGTLPVLNDAAVALGVRAALALGATAHDESAWARKHYFYPDLPKGYQISQFDRPLATGGTIHARVGGEVLAVPLVRLHLEEDAGRMVHGPDGTHVDWNRAGVPLAEIVSAPALGSPEAAEAFLRMLHRVLVAAGVTPGDLEKGHFRCDANVSVHRPGEPLGVAVEVKNLNSFRFVAQALRYEVDRQVGVLSSGGVVHRETRTWDRRRTVVLRRKEAQADYRYLPEPDLPRLVVSEAERQAAREALPGAPLDLWLLAEDAERVRRWQADYGLDAYLVGVLTADPEVEALFRGAVAAGGHPRAMANWVQGDVLRKLKEDGDAGVLGPEHLVALQRLVDEGVVGLPVARQLFDEVWATGTDPATLVERRGLRRVSGEAELLPLVQEVVARNPSQVAQYRAGKTRLIGFFVGQVMKATGGQADAREVTALLERVLGEGG